MKVVRIKPHHFIDIIADVGRGQMAWEPHPYGHAVHTVAAIRADLHRTRMMDT